MLFGSLAILTVNQITVLDPWLCVITLSHDFAFRQSVGRDHAPRDFRRSDFAPSRFRVILLLSAAPALMAQFSFRVGLCVTGFSRSCSFSEQFYYGTFQGNFQSLNCSKNVTAQPAHSRLSFREIFLALSKIFPRFARRNDKPLSSYLKIIVRKQPSGLKTYSADVKIVSTVMPHLSIGSEPLTRIRTV